MIESCATVAGKLAFLKGELRPNHQYKIALYTSAAELGPATKTYTPAGEVVAQGYKPLALPAPVFSSDATSAFFGFSGDVKWQNSTISADGALIYDETLGNLALFVVAFPEQTRSTNHEFAVTLVEKFFQI